MKLPPPAPVFNSMASTTALEGSAYTYQLSATDPAGGTVSFRLTQGPAGAMLSGSMLSWTPTPDQSRVADNFSVTATTSEGGQATQSFSVTPNGTVHVSAIDTFWTAKGAMAVPNPLTQLTGVAGVVTVLVPQPDGSLLTISATANGDGTFQFANVPGGHYWLQITPGLAYWTSSSHFDFGRDIVGARLGVVTGGATTSFALNATGLDPSQSGGWFAFQSDLPLPLLDFPVAGLLAGSTTFTETLPVGNIDVSQASEAFLMQYEPLSTSGFSGVALGPSAILTNVTFQNGVTNPVNAMLTASSKQSVAVSINGSQWGPLFAAAGPTAATPVGAVLNISAQPFVTGRFARSLTRILGPDVPLVSPLASNALPRVFSTEATNCTSQPLIPIPLTPGLPQPPATVMPAVVMDQSLGTLEYEDPFPAAWTRFFSFCQKATVTVPIPNTSLSTPFTLAYGENTTLPTTAVTPLAGVVQNPMINGASLLTSGTITKTPITLSWNAPSGMKPFGYTVQLFVPLAPNLPTNPPTQGPLQYWPSDRFNTADTSMTLPVTLPAGQVFVVVITALVDGSANMETSPNRSSLPTAFTSMVSAPMTIGPAGAPMVIHGDARLVPAGRPAEKEPELLHVQVQRIQTNN